MMHLCCGLRFDMADIADQSHTGGITASSTVHLLKIVRIQSWKIFIQVNGYVLYAGDFNGSPAGQNICCVPAQAPDQNSFSAR